MDCPRCRTPLDSHQASRLVLHGCTTCGGIWLDADASQRVVESIDPAVVAAADDEARSARVQPNVESVAQCPVCQRALGRMPIEQARVMVDACPGHGVWFDRNELQIVVRAVAPTANAPAPVGPSMPGAAVAPGAAAPMQTAPIGGASPAAAFFTNDLGGAPAAMPQAPGAAPSTGWSAGKTALAVGGGVAAVAGVAYVATHTNMGRELVRDVEGAFGGGGGPQQQFQQQQQPWTQSPQQPGGLAAIGSVLSKLF